jgi:NAD+ synthase (glutamine-hydrolysing)
VELPLIYAHLVGGQDEVIFDGGSFAVNADGSLAARAPAFQEDLFYVTVHPERKSFRLAGPMVGDLGDEEELWHALVLGVRDYIGKNGFPACCWASRAASTPRWCWRSRRTRWAPTRSARS